MTNCSKLKREKLFVASSGYTCGCYLQSANVVNFSSVKIFVFDPINEIDSSDCELNSLQRISFSNLMVFRIKYQISKKNMHSENLTLTHSIGKNVIFFQVFNKRTILLQNSSKKLDIGLKFFQVVRFCAMISTSGRILKKEFLEISMLSSQQLPPHTLITRFCSLLQSVKKTRQSHRQQDNSLDLLNNSS